jgi:1-acyl-sn-glycerol-3-phosphate acyltransferase
MFVRLKRRILQAIVAFFMRAVSRVEINGLEKVRDIKGKAIFVSNHLGRLDAGLAFLILKREDIILVVAEKYRDYPIFRFLVKQLDLLWLDRFGSDLGTMKEVLRRLDRGGVLMIAPEGTRSTTEALLEGKPGATYLAAKSGAVVIPVGIAGSEDRIVMSALRKFQRPRVVLNIGEAFSIPPLPKTDRDGFLRKQTDEIMVRIARLLPEKNRGFYTKHVGAVGLSA